MLTTLLLTAMLSVAGSDTDLRNVNYYPEGRDIVCVNGENRYTRALYGTHTAWRLETSDRPAFAGYRKGEGRNIAFSLTVGDTTIALDSTDYCKAAYQGGMRHYVLRDHRWGDAAQIELTAITAMDDDGALWRIAAKGLPAMSQFTVTLADVRSTKFQRGGDLGKDDLTKFEADHTKTPLQVSHFAAQDTSFVLLKDNNALTVYYGVRGKENAAEGYRLWRQHESYRQQLMSRVEINTPDPVFNTVGSVMMHAADGLWDGESWMHGCVGWRTPLAGWRGAYCGDALGWQDRSYSHFNAYANSQVTAVEPTIAHPSQDPKFGMARAEKRWGTQMYSNGYICRYPNRNNSMTHYDMNLNYIDGLLWHLSYDADTVQLRRFWPVLKSHLAWEKRNFDPDGDHLYDAYCCIWASDALYYNSGAVTHSSAYNYRGNLMAARIAELLGEDGSAYRQEAEAILAAMNARLWMDDRGTWCEFQDFMGLKRQHPSAALWTIYTPIDCQACTPEQAWRATEYVDRDIPHIPIRIAQPELLGLQPGEEFFTVSTTDWQPYVWSTNNVAHEEVANMALAYLQAGRKDVGFSLLKGDLIDEMFLGKSPGNFGQISYYDKVLSEAYRDFGDNIGVTSRAIVNGLFGILPDALNGRCVIKPAFPDHWQEASIRTPYLTYRYHREGSKDVYDIEQSFTKNLQIVVLGNAGGGEWLEVKGTDGACQRIVLDRSKLPSKPVNSMLLPAKKAVLADGYLRRMGLEDFTPVDDSQCVRVDLNNVYNSRVDDIFRNRYLSPRSPYTTLEIPVQGIGQWCHPEWMADIAPFTAAVNGIYDTRLGVKFSVGSAEKNIVYTSLWNNYPDSVVLTMPRGRYSDACLMLAGSTNSMQSRIANGEVVATYTDGTTDVMPLENPINWCAIEQDYVFDDHAFWSAPLKAIRFRLDNGFASRYPNEGKPAVATSGGDNDSGVSADRAIDGGAGTLLKMPLDRKKKLKSLTLRTLSNDVVIGVMGVTLVK